MTEVFLCTARRTPTGRRGGALAIVRPDDKAALVVGGLPDLPPDLSEDEAIVGCANQAGEGNRNVARRAVLPARLGPQGPALAVNRFAPAGRMPRSWGRCAPAWDMAWRWRCTLHDISGKYHDI